LLALAVQWYWPRAETTIVLGVPAWVGAAIRVAVAMSGYTAWLLWNHWPEGEDAS